MIWVVIAFVLGLVVGKAFWRAVSQVANTILGAIPTLRNLGFGDEDETISSVLGKLSQSGCVKCGLVCKVLDFLFMEEDHCIRAIEYDEGVKRRKKTN